MAKRSCLVTVCCTLLLALIHGVASQRGSCAHDCIDLTKCPALAQLLRNPTNANIKTLQDATCSFSGNVPKVCCPRETTPKPSLLPRNCGQGTTDHRIVGGHEAPLGGFPWMAALGYKEVGFDEVRYLCAGSIINERYILTAAHCVTPAILALRKLEVITLGEWEFKSEIDCQVTRSGDRVCSDPVQNVTHEEIITHPTYNTRAIHSDDIALIRLSRPVDLSGNWIHPVCLPPQGLSAPKVMVQKEGIAAGWGNTENGTTSDRLLQVVLPLVDNSVCNDTYDGRTVREQICMGGVAGQDSCGGDSGGPLVISGPGGPPFLQIGVVSYGPSNCGLQSVPGVYTDVTYYRNWIEENMQP